VARWKSRSIHDELKGAKREQFGLQGFLLGFELRNKGGKFRVFRNLI
jgi:hypothetical protein